MEEILEKTGLNKNESKVYIALLDIGLTSAKAIIEKTGLHRQLIYDALDLLIDKGLVSFILQAKRKYFRASDPKEFFEYFEKQREEIQKQEEHFKQILPKLEAMKKATEESQETTIYKGNKGIRALMDDILEGEEELLSIGASDITAEGFQYQLRFNLPRFHKIREEKKIPMKLLLSEELRTRAIELGKLKHSQIRILPKQFTANSSTNIYGDKVSILMWGKEPFGILIKSKDIAKAQKKHFNLLWAIGKQV